MIGNFENLEVGAEQDKKEALSRCKSRIEVKKEKGKPRESERNEK